MEDLFYKVMSKITTNEDAENMARNYGLRNFDFDSFANASGNHLFDDNPDVFGITKQEGHEIRAAFQTNHDKDSEGGKRIKESLEKAVNRAIEDEF